MLHARHGTCGSHSQVEGARGRTPATRRAASVLFGSTARGDAREDSDVDLFFDHERGKLGLYELMDVKDAAARILGRKTDIMARGSIHKALRQNIEADAVPVF